MTPFEAGQAAFQSAQTILDNPHAGERQPFIQWVEGWNSARMGDQ